VLENSVEDILSQRGMIQLGAEKSYIMWNYIIFMFSVAG
jgi:hypothetical protein